MNTVDKHIRNLLILKDKELGIPNKEIAAKHGLTVASCYWILDVGLYTASARHVEWLALQKDLELGMSHKAAAEKHNFEYNTVYGILKGLKVKLPDGRRSNGKHNKKVKYLGVDWSRKAKDLAMEYGVTPQAIYEARKRYGGLQDANRKSSQDRSIHGQR